MWHSAWRWLYPGLRIKRWVLLFSVGLLLLVLGLTTIINYQVFGVLEEFLFRVLRAAYARKWTLSRRAICVTAWWPWPTRKVRWNTSSNTVSAAQGNWPDTVWAIFSWRH